MVPPAAALVVERHSLLPAGFTSSSAAAHVAVDAAGRRLYASNRGHDSIATFEVREDVGLSPVGHAPTGGAHPRHFAIDPSGHWLVVANRDADRLTALALDDDGRPQTTGGEVHVRARSCVTFVFGR